MLEAGVLPEVRGQDSPASGPGSLHSSLCCRGQLRRLAARGHSSLAEGRDLGSQRYHQGGRQEVQGVRPGMQGHEEQEGRAWLRGDSWGNPGLVQGGRQLLEQENLVLENYPVI